MLENLLVFENNKLFCCIKECLINNRKVISSYLRCGKNNFNLLLLLEGISKHKRISCLLTIRFTFIVIFYYFKNI